MGAAAVVAALAAERYVHTDTYYAGEDRCVTEVTKSIAGGAGDAIGEFKAAASSALTAKIENGKTAAVEKESKGIGGAARRIELKGGGGAKARAMAEAKAECMAKGLAEFRAKAKAAGACLKRDPFILKDGVSIYPISGSVISDARLNVWGFINPKIAEYAEYEDFETSLKYGYCSGSGSILFDEGFYKIRPSVRMDARCLGKVYESVDDIKRVLESIYIGEDKDMPSKALAHMMKNHNGASKLLLVDFSVYTDHEGVKEILKKTKKKGKEMRM